MTGCVGFIAGDGIRTHDVQLGNMHNNRVCGTGSEGTLTECIENPYSGLLVGVPLDCLWTGFDGTLTELGARVNPHAVAGMIARNY